PRIGSRRSRCSRPMKSRWLHAAVVAAAPSLGIADPAGLRGVCFAPQSADVAPRVDGVVRRVQVHLGDAVAAGQAIVVLESPELVEDVAAAKAAVVAAVADSLRLAVELDHAQRLLERREATAGVFTRDELESTKVQCT